MLLTGTPLQNNLIEYFHMVNSVKPGFLGKLARFRQLYEEHIKKGEVKEGEEEESQSTRRELQGDSSARRKSQKTGMSVPLKSRRIWGSRSRSLCSW